MLSSKFLFLYWRDSASFVQSYFLDKLQLTHLIIHELNVIGGILEKSKIYGADFVSMVDLLLFRCKEAVSSRSKLWCAESQKKEDTSRFLPPETKSPISPFSNVDLLSFNLPNSFMRSNYFPIQTCAPVRLPISVPLCDDRLQYLLLNMLRIF